MSNQPKNEAQQRLPSLWQGERPPTDPVKGDLWIDNFQTTHSWGGYYWVKVQSPTLETSGYTASTFIGYFGGTSLFYGSADPPHNDNTYWITDTRELYESEVYESVVKQVIKTSANPNIAGGIYLPTRIWQKITDTGLLSVVRGLVAEYLLSKQQIVPEVSLAAEKCNEEEAAEKFEAFEKIVEPTGRLDIQNDIMSKLDTLYLHSTVERSEFVPINWKAKEPDYKVIPPQEPGLIKQIQQANTYDNLTEENLLKFIKTLKFKS